VDNPAFEFGRFRIDVAGRHLLRDNEVVPLTSKAFDTLLLLVRHRDRVVTKDELMQAVWPNTFVSDDSLTQAISSLRRALGNSELIATIPRRGYRFIESTTGIVIDTSAAIEPPPPAASSPQDTDAPATVAPPPAHIRSRAWLVAAVATLGIATGVTADRFLRRPAAIVPAASMRFTQEAPTGTHVVSGGVLSPDGSALAFVAEDGRTGISTIWVRALNSADARPVPGTEQAVRPFWSPDGRSIGFVANGRLRTVSLDGGPPRNLAAVRSYPGGAAWSPDVILFANWRAGLDSVAPWGGPVTAMTTLDSAAGETAHQWPSFLPDNRHFLFTVLASRRERAGIYVGTIGSTERTRLLDGAHQAAIFVAPGYLVYLRGGELMAQRFDPDRLRLDGSPVTIASGVTAPGIRNSATLSVAHGLLAYGGGPALKRLVWFNRHGERLGAIDTPVTLHHPAFCANGKELMAASADDRSDVWVVDLERGVTNRLVADAYVPTPSPDGSMLAYSSNRGTGFPDIYIRRRNAHTASDAVLVTSAEAKYVNDWTGDGRYLVYQSSNAKTGEDLWVVPAGGGTPTPFLRTEFNEIQSRVSPDGQWLAYASDESGTWEVYVQSFPTPGAKQVVSLHGGGEPVWRHDGRELYYLSADHTLMAVEVSEAGGALRVTSPRALFRPPVVGALNDYRSHYAATSDGQRFVVDAVDTDAPQGAITVVTNWTSMMKR
jgi:DNA-binding winged helix-turn-helix (wHTH) protein/Tol biopolymer transport system component